MTDVRRTVMQAQDEIHKLYVCVFKMHRTEAVSTCKVDNV